MNAQELYLAVYDDEGRKKLERVPTHVQYITEGFIVQYNESIMHNFKGPLFNNLYFDIPCILGFDAIFAPFPQSFKTRRIKIKDKDGKLIKIGIDGQGKRRSSYYEGGYIKSIDILEELKANLSEVDRSEQISKLLDFYDKFAPYIFPILSVEGIFDRVWQSMGFTTFSLLFRKRDKLITELIKFYANLLEMNLQGLINASKGRVKIINILDDVAYKGRPMISPARWEQEFIPHYKKLNSILEDAGIIPQIHTDGDATEMIPSFQKAGFRGLQGWEGGCDPAYINDKFPDFVVVGFGDVSDMLPYGTPEQINLHVKELMDALKENRHFILGPSTVIFKEIPLESVQIFMKAAKKYGCY